MHLQPGDIRTLPLAVALVDGDNELVAASPEWRQAGPGALTYRQGSYTLVVEDDEEAHPDVGAATRLLIDDVAAAAAQHPADARGRRTRMLATSLELVAGIPRLRPGTCGEAIECLRCADDLTAPTPLEISGDLSGTVPDPEVTAHALWQILINARTHDGADAIRIHVERHPDGPAFLMRWRGIPTPEGVRTARHQADRDGWGLGFVRLAADALGALYQAPGRTAPGQVEATFSFTGRQRLSLPIAVVDGRGTVEKASDGWDEETGALPGRPAPAAYRPLIDEARATPGTIAALSTMRARSSRWHTWLAIPPQGMRDRARDVIAGLRHEHERDLHQAPQPWRTRLVAQALALQMALGDAPRPSPAAWWNERYPEACDAVGLPRSLIPWPGAGDAPNPYLAAHLTQLLAAHLEVTPTAAWLQVPASHRQHPVVRLLGDDRGRIPLLR